MVTNLDEIKQQKNKIKKVTLRLWRQLQATSLKLFESSNFSKSRNIRRTDESRHEAFFLVH